MKKLTLSGLALVILMVCALALTGATQAKQKTVAAPAWQTKCRAFNSKELSRTNPQELRQFSQDPLVQNFLVKKRINPNALDELVASGDKSLIPYLEHVAQMEGGEKELLALIKLGDREKFNQLVTLTRCVKGDKYTSEDDFRQRKAIELMGLLKTPEANQVLYNLLDDNQGHADGDMVFLTPSQKAQRVLYSAFNPGPEGLRNPSGSGNLDEERAKIWKKWLKTNNLVP
jgi:hypothetical protein